MNRIAAPLLLVFLLGADDKPVPKLPLGKETTYFTGPLDKEGYIDYEAALNDRLSKGITSDKNAAVLLWKALGPTPFGAKAIPAEYFKRLGIEAPPPQGDYFAFNKDGLKFDKNESDAFGEQQSRAIKRPWTAKENPHIAAWLNANERPLAIVVEATKRPDYFSPIICRRNEDGRQGPMLEIILYGVQEFRSMASALAARAMLKVADGKFDDAWQDLLACHRLGRLVGRGACLIQVLVGIEIEGMATNAELSYLERGKLDRKPGNGPP